MLFNSDKRPYTIYKCLKKHYNNTTKEKNCKNEYNTDLHHCRIGEG